MDVTGSDCSDRIGYATCADQIVERAIPSVFVYHDTQTDSNEGDPPGG